MSSSIFEEGRNFGTRKIGPVQFKMRTPIPAENGFVERECSNLKCSLSLFKGKLITGATISPIEYIQLEESMRFNFRNSWFKTIMKLTAGTRQGTISEEQHGARSD